MNQTFKQTATAEPLHQHLQCVWADELMLAWSMELQVNTHITHIVRCFPFRQKQTNSSSAKSLLCGATGHVWDPENENKHCEDLNMVGLRSRPQQLVRVQSLLSFVLHSIIRLVGRKPAGLILVVVSRAVTQTNKNIKKSTDISSQEFQLRPPWCLQVRFSRLAARVCEALSVSRRWAELGPSFGHSEENSAETVCNKESVQLVLQRKLKINIIYKI